MVVLQFAWGGGTNNVHLPHMHYENSFCYPGTHDNETSVGWFKDSANEQDKMYLKAYLGTEGEDIAWDFIRCSMQSVSSTCVFLMQVSSVPKHPRFLHCEATHACYTCSTPLCSACATMRRNLVLASYCWLTLCLLLLQGCHAVG